MTRFGFLVPSYYRSLLHLSRHASSNTIYYSPLRLYIFPYYLFVHSIHRDTYINFKTINHNHKLIKITNKLEPMLCQWEGKWRWDQRKLDLLHLYLLTQKSSTRLYRSMLCTIFFDFVDINILNFFDRRPGIVIYGEIFRP